MTVIAKPNLRYFSNDARCPATIRVCGWWNNFPSGRLRASHYLDTSVYYRKKAHSPEHLELIALMRGMAVVSLNFDVDAWTADSLRICPDGSVEVRLGGAYYSSVEEMKKRNTKPRMKGPRLIQSASDHDPLNLVEAHLIAPPVIELRCAGRCR